MADTSQSTTLETRRHQMFPMLQPAEIDRLRRFAEPRSFQDEELLVRAGQQSTAMFIILKGEAVATLHDGLIEREPFVTIGAGEFTGELAQLSARPALVDIEAKGRIDTLAIPSQRIRDVLIEEA